MKKNTPTNGFGVAALVLGIVSILTCLFYYLAIPTGILAIIFGAKGSKNGSKLAKAGLILGIIGLSLFLVLYGSVLSIMMLV